MDVVALEGMSGGELLDHAGDLARIRNRCEVEILQVAVQHALLHNPDTLDPAETGRPGREQAKRCGGEGAPEVTDFAAAELGARLGSSTISAWWLMCDGLDLVYRLPKLWARVEAGEVRAYLARLVAKKTRDLTIEETAYVDARVAKYADGRLTWTRFQARLDGLVAAADPAATAEAERKAARQQVATPTRPDPENDHGLRGFYIKAPAATVLVFDAALQRIADILKNLGDPAPVDQRRVTALLVLSRPDLAAELLAAYQAWSDRPDDPAGDPPAEDPCSTDGDAPRTGPKPVIDWASLLPQVVINLHTYAAPDREPGSEGIARIERCGAVTESWIKDHLSPHAKVTVKPVLDIEALAPVDAYEIPERHRRAVRLMTPADTFPFSTSLDPDQIDHTEPYQHG
ncbi:MAG TPA: DUF222 domain-containing protein, partial [Nocardioides sp.]|nr:DUF222 domain-containing protein [Nocardioides sp.]